MTSIMFRVINCMVATKVSALIDYVIHVINALETIGLELRNPSARVMLLISDC